MSDIALEKTGVSLRQILQNDKEDAKPLNIDTFRKYCWKNYQAENVEFWLAVERYRGCCNDGLMSKPHLYMQEVKELMQTYIDADALFQINLSEVEKNAIEETFKESLKNKVVNSSLFDKAQEHIFSVMNQDVFPKFMKDVNNEHHLDQAHKDALWFQNSEWPTFQEFFLLKTMQNRADERILDLCSAILLLALILTVMSLKVNYLYFYLMFGFFVRTICGYRLDPQAILVVVLFRPAIQKMFGGWPADSFSTALPFRISEFLCLCWLIGAFVLNLNGSTYYESVILWILFSLCTASGLLNVSFARLFQWLISRNRGEEKHLSTV